MKIASGMFLTVLLCAAVAGAAINDPVGYWDFESNLDNQVTLGTAYNASVLTGTPETGAAGGIYGNALNLVDAEQDSINLPFGSQQLGDSFTVSAWYRQSASGTGRDFVFESAGNYDVSYGTGGDNNTFSSYVGQRGAGSVTTSYDQWHHILHSFEASGGVTTLSVYLDGQFQQSEIALSVDVAFPSINVGTYRNANDRFWEGMIDEVALWDRALNATEAEQVYQRSLGGQALEYTVQHYVPPSIDMGGTLTQYNLDMETPIDDIVEKSGWATDTFTAVEGADNDLGDGGFSEGTYLRTQGAGDNTLKLNFVNMPAHNAVSLGMIVAQLESLDPARDGDRLTIKVDGEELLGVGLGYGPWSGGDQPVVDDGHWLGHSTPVMINGVEVDPSVILDTMTLGENDDVNVFEGDTFKEHMFDFGQLDAFQNIPHTGDTLTVEIVGYQNQGSGEYFGLDDISIDLVGDGALEGDLNGDGFVGGDDLDIVRGFWGQNVTAGDPLKGDPSGDGFVGGDDLDIVRGEWGQGVPPAPAAVPEPGLAGLALSALAALALSYRRKH